MAHVDDESVTFLPEAHFRTAIYPLFEKLKQDLLKIIPGADIQHVGSTAIPGSLTKGDLDIQVRVAASQYNDAKNQLCKQYSINTGGFASDDAMSFEDYSNKPSIGVHLTVIGSQYDIQYRFRDLLIENAQLRIEYDKLKCGFEGKSMKSYREAKANFVESILGLTGQNDE
jgi:GrpB-like predicted nucleotidyltransferase (UPF0157 family)